MVVLLDVQILSSDIVSTWRHLFTAAIDSVGCVEEAVALLVCEVDVGCGCSHQFREVFSYLFVELIHDV